MIDFQQVTYHYYPFRSPFILSHISWVLTYPLVKTFGTLPYSPYSPKLYNLALELFYSKKGKLQAQKNKPPFSYKKRNSRKNLNVHGKPKARTPLFKQNPR